MGCGDCDVHACLLDHSIDLCPGGACTNTYTHTFTHTHTCDAAGSGGTGQGSGSGSGEGSKGGCSILKHARAHTLTHIHTHTLSLFQGVWLCKCVIYMLSCALFFCVRSPTTYNPTWSLLSRHTHKDNCNKQAKKHMLVSVRAQEPGKN